jgi:hypothetical protein
MEQLSSKNNSLSFSKNFHLKILKSGDGMITDPKRSHPLGRVVRNQPVEWQGCAGLQTEKMAGRFKNMSFDWQAPASEFFTAGIQKIPDPNLEWVK